ncbi:MAG: PQQ-dependent dehydrogenase, methanol/ethanol family [Vicinamibacterales bacterium]
MTLRILPWAGVTLVIALAAGLGGAARQAAHRAGSAAQLDDAALQAAATRTSDWITHGRTYDEQRFSPLDEIRETTVTRLGLAWSFETGTDRGLEATPLVADGVMYTTAAWSIVYALDARTGRLLWKWDPGVDRSRYDALACCDVVNRGVALYRGRVYVGVLDGRLAALDAATGAVAWQVTTVDQSKPYTITGAPRVVRGLVVIGNGGAEYGVRGYVTAYDAGTGRERWRVYTVPGDPSSPPESAAIAKALPTWKGGRWWEYGGGGTAWDSIAYDPALDLIYVGTGNGSPWNRHLRSPGGGDNLYLSSILAIRPSDGELVWHYQTTPGDNWDYTATQHMILADLPIGGRLRQVLMQAPKNGFFYVLDRRTGELISAKPYVATNWASEIDARTGRPREIRGADYRERGLQVRPGPLGGHNWQPMSFHPGTGLVYLPAQENARYYEQPAAFTFRPGEWNLGLKGGRLPDEQRRLPWPSAGRLLAWDPVRNAERWRVEYGNYWNGGTLATAGNLVFQGTAAGELIAYRATDGQKLWSTSIDTGIVAPPISYSVGGRQHVALMAGWGGAFARRARSTGRVLVFALDGAVQLPPRPAARPVTRIDEQHAPETVAAGGALFRTYCERCHATGTLLPDLRRSPAGMFAAYKNILLEGTLFDRGMPSFADQLTGEEVRAVRAWVIAERNKLAGISGRDR